jgi:REP element-mobilizing transposase RayT
MPQSLVKNYIHITFSTKNREPLIHDSIEKELFKYIGGICNKLECYPVIVGGYKNHIHILCSLSRKIALMSLIEKIKSSSSKWIKSKGNRYQKFYWQRGYGCFSISNDKINIVKNYIANQKEHHQGKSFQTEYIDFIKENDIKYDEQYVWD